MGFGQDLQRRARIADRQPRRADVLRRRPQLEDGLRDDAQRSLGAHEKVLEVVARVVLLERTQSVPDVPVGQHDFEPQDEIAGIAIAEHLHAAGVGRQVAADHA